MDENQQPNANVDIEKLKKDLEDFLATAKQETEKVQTLANGISAKAEEVELYYSTYKDTRAKFDDSQTGLQALLNQSTNLKNQVQQLHDAAQAQVTQVTEKVNLVQAKVKEIETYHGSFVELRSKLDDGQTGLRALLDQATKLKAQIEQSNTAAQTHLQQITEKVASITAKVQEIEQYYTATFLPLKAKVDDPKLGIQATLNIATDLKNEIVKTKTSADQRHLEIQGLAEKSSELKQSAESSFQEIEGLKVKSEEFKESIGETLDLVTASSLTDSFIKRRDTIAKNARFWMWANLVSTVALGAAVLFIYYLQTQAVNGLQDWHYWYRYLFTSPLIYLVYICSHNYNMERDYEERYAFKTVLSTSLQAYIKLLSDKFADKKDELLKFALSSIERIYKEPYTDTDQSQEVYGGFKNIFNFGLKNNSSKSKVTTQTAEVTQQAAPTDTV